MALELRIRKSPRINISDKHIENKEIADGSSANKYPNKGGSDDNKFTII